MNRRIVISSYKLFEDCKAAFPKREVASDMHPHEDVFYFFSRKGEMRHVDTRDGSIWVCDYERGFPFIKRVRTCLRMRKKRAREA